MTRRRVDPAAFVAGGLDEAGMAAARRLLDEDPVFRSEVERLRRPAAALAATAATDGGPAPELDLAAIRVARPPADRRRARGAVVLRPAAAFAAAAGLLVAGAFGGAMAVHDGGAPADPVAAAPAVRLAAIGGAPGGSAVVRLADARAGLEVRGLAPSRPGEHYELWLLNTPQDLVSVATFRVDADGRARIAFPLGVDPGRYAFLDVSVERDDGNPAHSARSVLRSERRSAA